MIHRLLVAAMLAVLGLGAQAADTSVPGAGVDKVTWEARAKFIKKCVRDRTKASCEAPDGARVAQLP